MLSRSRTVGRRSDSCARRAEDDARSVGRHSPGVDLGPLAGDDLLLASVRGRAPARAEREERAGQDDLHEHDRAARFYAGRPHRWAKRAAEAFAKLAAEVYLKQEEERRRKEEADEAERLRALELRTFVAEGWHLPGARPHRLFRSRALASRTEAEPPIGRSEGALRPRRLPPPPRPPGRGRRRGGGGGGRCPARRRVAENVL
jgi:hypothetical protein